MLGLRLRAATAPDTENFELCAAMLSPDMTPGAARLGDHAAHLHLYSGPVIAASSHHVVTCAAGREKGGG